MRTCPTCGAESPEDARFCVECGSSLAARCERCGAELPGVVRFCPSCGTPVGEQAHAGEERKLVTVLFADVAGSTGLGERLDPERLKEVMDAYFEAMRREIDAEGGTVEKFIGDAVVAVFGVPSTHEDDPTRALRAALRMRRRLQDLNRTLDEAHGVTLSMRTGINTGEVMAATSARPEVGMVTGDAVNVAARLEQSAELGEILVAERTVRASRGMRFADMGPLSLKGRDEAVRTFELLEAQPGEEPETAASRAPLVGREKEITLLQTVFARVVSEGRPSLVTIYGEAGVGKSRLVEELVAWSGGLEDQPVVVKGRCIPYGEGVMYWPLAEILKRDAEVLGSDPPEVALEKIRATATKMLSGDLSPDPERAAAALAFTLGLDDPATPFSNLEARQLRGEVASAWRSYFSAIASGCPALIVIEDIHWADPALLDLLEELAERVEGPALFLCPARRELTARRPGWGGGRWNFSSVLLEPLSAKESEELLSFLLPSEEEISGELRSQILERAGGNPLFLEEIVRHLIDERRLVAAEEGWLAATSEVEVEIPDTVQGLLAARMDLLGPMEKRVLQSAAVVGRVFWSGPVAGLMDRELGEIEESLARLEGRGLVLARLSSSVEGEREYSFKHVLTRDAAYDSLPKRDRAGAHAQVAAWIETRAGERHREFVELLAHHYAEAYRGTQEDGRAGREGQQRLREGAFRYSLLASQDARSRLALGKAERFAETALSFAASPLERSQGLEALGRAYVHDYRGDLAWQCLKEAVDLRVQEGDDPRTVARLCASALEVATRHRGTMRSRLPREEVTPYLEIGLQNAGEGDTEELTRLLIVKSFWPYSFRELETTEDEQVEARRAGERAADMAERLGGRDLASAALDGVGSFYVSRGLYGIMQETLHRRLELATALTDSWEVGDTYATAAWAMFHIGRYRDALAHAEEGYRRCLDGPQVMALYCLDWRAVAKCRLGDWDGLFQDVELVEQMLGDRRGRPPGFASDHVAAATFVAEAQGDRVTADRLLEVLAWLERVEERASPERATWHALVLARRGMFAEARAEIDRVPEMLLRSSRGFVLEGWCDLVAEEEAWEEAPRIAAESRAHAKKAGLLALRFYAARLEGRAALAEGDQERATTFLEAAADGFDGLEARWEAAVTRLDLSRACMGAGDGDAARQSLGEAAPVLEALRSVREVSRARELLTALD